MEICEKCQHEIYVRMEKGQWILVLDILGRADHPDFPKSNLNMKLVEETYEEVARQVIEDDPLAEEVLRQKKSRCRDSEESNTE